MESIAEKDQWAKLSFTLTSNKQEKMRVEMVLTIIILWMVYD